MSAEIEGGATLWARQTIESEIFLDKPDKWFKIWFYLVNRVSHKDTKRYKRGETYYHQEWICDATGASPDQVKKCLAWLRDTGMISTRRSTRGTWLEIPKYSHFQTLDNYYYDVKAPDEARKKHERSTTEAPRYYKNDNNDNNEKKERREKPSASYLISIPQEDIDEFVKRFDIYPKQVISLGETLKLYCESKGKRYSNYKSFLLNAIKRDFKERVVEAPKKEVPEITEEQRKENIERLKEMKAKLFKKL